MKVSAPHLTRQRRWRLGGARVLLLASIATLSACGGGADADLEPAAGAPPGPLMQPRLLATAVPASPPQDRALAVPLLPRQPVPSAAATPLAVSEDPGLLLLLIPDELSSSDPGVAAWADAASEVGARLATVTDSQFLAMGSSGALRFAGLILPDLIHSIASDALVQAVRDYTRAGGKTFLSFDFGALTLTSGGVPVYPIPKSRLSDLAGVDYVLYDKYLAKTTGLGPVTAMRSTLRDLLVPPGKSQPYPPAGGDGSATLVPSALRPAGKGETADHVPLLAAGGLTSGEVLYLAPSVTDPGGVRGFDPQQAQMLPTYSVAERMAARRDGAKPRQVKVHFGNAFKAPRPAAPTRALPAPTSIRPLVAEDDTTLPEQGAAPAAREEPAELGADTLHAYSGYLFGYLVYPSYQTEGSYAGTTLATSPDFGLVAGLQSYGAGKVLFVNLPLTYLKGRTDALPMHGFLTYFVKNVVNGLRLSAMPNAVPGITFNWHLDSKEAQAPMLSLEKAGVFKTAGYSMHMTAGPDTIVPGDRLGFDLNNNRNAQSFLRRMVGLGHSVGSHGGWIHDYYGLNADETNQREFQPLLELNRRAVDGAIGRASRDYSAPEGNNPLWAMNWLESQGVVGAYFGGHTGLGITRQYRDGSLLNPRLWVMPVTPYGNYATFEEFQDFNVPKAEVIDWYRSMVDFGLTYNTARLVYAHPPGAYEWLDVTRNFIAYGNSKGANRFRWYTIERLADFMAKRDQVRWSQTPLPTGALQVVASHPSSLAEMVWTVPKDRYLKPTSVSGASVADGGAFWLVKARAVSSLRFQVRSNPAYRPA